MGELTEEFTRLIRPWENKLQSKEADLEKHLKEFEENRQSESETIQRIIKDVETLLGPSPANTSLTRRMEREIGTALSETDSKTQKSRIIQDLKNIIHGGAELQLIAKQKATKVIWGAMRNRKGEVGENKVALALNQLMEDFSGMSVMGMKTHTYLYDFLDKLDIELTHRMTKDHITKKVKELGEVEHDHISTWMEENELVVNLVQCKTMEVKPWNPPNKTRIGQMAFEHGKHGLLQLNKDFLTFKELLPDILEDQMRKIRWYLPLVTSYFPFYRFQYFVALPDVSCQAWIFTGSTDHILFTGGLLF